MPLLTCLRTRAFALLALCLFAGSSGALALPYGLDEVSTMQEARARLWDLREAGTIDQGQYLELARKLEPRLRSNDLQRFMDAFKIKHGGRKPGQSGGILSDVDAIAPDGQTYEQFLRWVKKQDPDVEVFDRYSFRSEKLDLVGWRPPDPGTAPRSAPAVIEQGMAQALNDEFALGAQAGGKTHPLESNLENLSKAGKHLFKPIEPGHLAEHSVIQAGKDVLRSMRAAGMCADNPAVCGWLNDLRSRARSPKELGFDNLEQLQDRLKFLAAQAYRTAEAQFASEYDALLKQIERAATGTERDRLIKQADALGERALRMGARFEVLHGQYPKGMKEISGIKTPRQFWSEQNGRIRGLKAPVEAANANVARAQKLSLTLNMLEFAKCLQEDAVGTQASRRAQAVRCIGRATADHLKGQIMERLLDKAKVVVTVYVPGGPVIATVIPVITAGVTAYESGVQLGEAAWEYVQKNLAEKERDESERVLATGQQRNVGEFARRLAAEEAVVAEALRDVAGLKQGLLEDLMRMAREQAALLERTKALGPRRVRLQALMPGLKAEIDRCAARRGQAGPDRVAQLAELLGRAKGDVSACRERRDLESADAAYRQSTAIVSALSRELEQARRPEAAGASADDRFVLPDAIAGGSRRAGPADEARAAHAELEEVALAARSLMRETSRFRERVEALNQDIAARKAEQNARLEAFTQAVTAALVEAVEQHSPRLQGLRTDIGALVPLATEQWHPQWQAIAQRDGPLRELVQYMDDSGRQNGRVVRELADCRPTGEGDRLAGELDRAEALMEGPGGEYRAQRADCLARLQGTEVVAGEAGFKELVGREEAFIKSRLEALKAARGEALARYESGLKTAQGVVAQRAARGRAPAAVPVGDLAAAPELCGQVQSAHQKLAATLRSLEGDQGELEALLKQAQQLAGSCKGRSAAATAQQKVDEAAALQTGVDQQEAALALLAVQVEGLAGKRLALAKRRTALQAMLSPGPAPAVGVPGELHALQQVLDELKAHDRRWSAAEADKLKTRLAALRGQGKALPPATLDGQMARFTPLLAAVAGLGFKDEELARRAQEHAALRQRAEAAARAGQPTGEADTRALRAAVQAAACLDQPEPDMQAGMSAAKITRTLAQLATGKLGAGAREKILACTEQLARQPSAVDKQAQVAEKVCRYPGSEAVWDESQGRPLCRCRPGSRWNKEQTACVSDQEALVAAKVCRYPGSEAVWDESQGRPLCRCRPGSMWNKEQTACIPEKEARLADANCARFPNTEPRWSEEKGQVVCSCRTGYVANIESDGCEPDAQAAMAKLQCSGPNEFAYWDVTKGQAQCRCEPGHERNPRSGACEPDRDEQLATKDCSRFPNTESFWDEAKGRARCTCRAGYRSNATHDGCVDPKAAIAAARCGDYAEAYWDDDRSQARCRCRGGAEVDPASRRCRPLQQARPPAPRPPEPRVAQPSPARSRYADWVGTWQCATRASAMGQSEITQRMTFRFKEEAGTLMMAFDDSEWGAPPMADDHTINLPGPPEWPVMRYTLANGQISSRMTMKYMGRTGTALTTCRK